MTKANVTDAMTDIDVTEAERAVFADIWRYRGYEEEAEAIMRGEWDSDMGLREITRHRTEATAQQAAEIAELRAEIERLRGERDNAIQQAQAWKMEAMSHKSTVHQAYQHITGATGEPGNWNGANPIIAALAREGEG